MAGSVNKAIIVGRLGKDPESRTFANGGRVVNLNVATSETWREKESGEKRERTTWHNVVIFNEGLGKIAEQYLRKGSRVYLEGQIESRKYQDQSGADRYVTEIVIRPYRGEIALLDGKEAGDGRTAQQRADEFQGPGGGRGFSDDLDDSVPF